jgi:hypothetical protein
VEPGSQSGGFFGSDDETLAAIERESGAETAEAIWRSWQLMRQPRELTEPEQTELRANTEPVLRDMRASGAIVPDIREQALDVLGPDAVCAWIQHPRNTGSMGIRVRLDLPPAERLADLAEQLQEWEVEELAATGRPATWPECPSHPNSHPLSPESHDGEAVWSCPVSGQVMARIGALRAPAS